MARFNQPVGSGIYIPYPAVTVGGKEFGRMRLDVPTGERKYTQQWQSGNHAYCPPQTPKPVLYVQEGEFKTISMAESGYHSIGVGGIESCCVKKVAGVEREVVIGLGVAASNPVVSRVEFVGDADTALIPRFAPAMILLATVLAKIGKPLFLKRLPINSVGKGVDDIKEVLGAGFNSWFDGLISVPVTPSTKPDALALQLLELEVENLKTLTDSTPVTLENARKRAIALVAGFHSSSLRPKMVRIVCSSLGFATDELDIAIAEKAKANKEKWEAEKAKKAAKELAKASYKTTSFSSPAKPAPAPARAPLVWTCTCGKYRKIKFRGVVCASCSVSVDLRNSPVTAKPAPAPAPAPAQNDPDAELRALLASRMYVANPPPQEQEPRFFINDIEICTACNLSSIAAAPKAGKSAASSAMIASTFADDKSDCLGFRSKNPDGWAVIHIDTEQSPRDHWQSIANVSRRAGCTNNEVPPWVLSCCCAGVTASQLRRSIPLLMSDAMAKFGGIHSVIIDGIADCVINVNDDEECNNLIAELHALAIKHNTNIINIIHTNHSDSKKKRGHLGSQLDRKCETNLELDRNGEISLIYADRNRHAPITKSQGPQFRYDPAHKMHMSVQKPTAPLPKFSSKLDHYLQQLQLSAQTYRTCTLRDLMASKCQIEPRQAANVISQLVDMGHLTQTGRGIYTYRPQNPDNENTHP